MTRTLSDLVSVGPATMSDFEQLEIHSVEQLGTCDPQVLYERLCELKGTRLDPCCADVFHAAVAQARNPDLPAAQCNWWYWSGVRKRRAAAEHK